MNIFNLPLTHTSTQAFDKPYDIRVYFSNTNVTGMSGYHKDR